MKLSTHPLINVVWSVATLFVVLSIWTVIYASSIVNPAIFPSPLAVAKSLMTMAADGSLLVNITSSLMRVAGGFSLGSLFGIGFGILTSQIGFLKRTVGFIINILRPIPALAILPLVIIWLGIGEGAKVFVISWGVFFPIWVSTHVGIGAVNIEYVWAAKNLGAKNKTIFMEVLLPAALDTIISGLKNGISIAFICLVAAEMIGASSGLGFQISMAHLTFKVDEMIANIIVVGCLGLLVDYLFDKTCKAIFPWRKLGRVNNG